MGENIPPWRVSRLREKDIASDPKITAVEGVYGMRLMFA